MARPAGGLSPTNVLWEAGLFDGSNDYRIWSWDGSTSQIRLAIDRTNGNVGIGTSTPLERLHVKGKLLLEGGSGDARLGFKDPPAGSAANEIYRNSADFTVLRNFNQLYTILELRAPTDSGGSAERESTLSLVRVDTQDNNKEFMDVYNNGYSSETQYGIRIQKRGSGAYRDFVFDKYSGSGQKVKLLVIGTESGNVGIGDKATPGAKLDVFGGDVYVSSAGNGIIFKSPDGSICKKLTIDNSGNPVWTTVTCP